MIQSISKKKKKLDMSTKICVYQTSHCIEDNQSWNNPKHGVLSFITSPKLAYLLDHAVTFHWRHRRISYPDAPKSARTTCHVLITAAHITISYQ